MKWIKHLTWTVKQVKLILWGKCWSHDSCLMQDFICIETDWPSLHTLIQTLACIPAVKRKYSPLWDKEKPWEISKVSKCSYVVSWGQRALIHSFVNVLSEAIQLVWEHIQSSPTSWDMGGEEINFCVEEWTCVSIYDLYIFMFRDVAFWH